ncbi:nucleolar protein 12 [Vigna unguiculata]|nr:nucleolar protein 12 [Vigna unguiculata]
MLSSCDKINAVMSYWVEQAGFNSVDLVKSPGVILLSLRKRIAPRACVLQFLVSKRLLRKDASLTAPFVLTEKLFLENYVKRFREDSSHLLKLYTENMSLGNDRDKACM